MRTLLFVGTYTKSCDSDGIYIYEFDTETAEATLIASTQDIISPSFLSISSDAKFVYSVNENGDKSTISAFAFDIDNSEIRLLNQLSSHGESPCYIVDDDNYVIVANYEGGNIAVFDKTADGSLAGIRQIVQHQGNGPNHKRQEKAHVHMTSFSPDGKYLLVNDLGADEICVYDFDSKAAGDVLSLRRKYKSKPGSGPRHLTFSRDGRYVYLLHELDGTLATFEYRDGALAKIDDATIVEDGFFGEIGGGDIHVDNTSQFLYATNRGDANTISVFKIAGNGKPLRVETVGTKGKAQEISLFRPITSFFLSGIRNRMRSLFLPSINKRES